MTLENANSESIDDLKVRIITNESVIGPSNLTSVSGGDVTGITAGGAVKAVVNVSENVDIEEVTLIPGLVINGDVRLCSNQLVNVNGPLNDCELI